MGPRCVWKNQTHACVARLAFQILPWRLSEQTLELDITLLFLSFFETSEERDLRRRMKSSKSNISFGRRTSYEKRTTLK